MTIKEFQKEFDAIETAADLDRLTEKFLFWVAVTDFKYSPKEIDELQTMAAALHKARTE